MANNKYTVMELEAIKKLCKCVNLVASLPADLIADTNVATNTTYSSYKIDAEMSALENDIQRIDAEMSGYYTNTEADDKFALKNDLDVLTTSFNNLVTSVEKKIDEDKIVTVLDDTVTDEQVASAKAVYDGLENINDFSVQVVKNSLNLNDITETGIYFFSRLYTPINTPTGANGWLLVMKGSYSDIVKQVWYSLYTADSNSYDTFERYNGGEGWTEWTKFLTETDVNLDNYFTKAEIESELGTERLGTTSQTVKGAINELFQSVSSGKTLVANAITDKGVSTATDATFATMATNISKINTNGYKEETASYNNTSTGANRLVFTFSANISGVKQITPPSDASCYIVPETSTSMFTVNGNKLTLYVNGAGTWKVTAFIKQ